LFGEPDSQSAWVPTPALRSLIDNKGKNERPALRTLADQLKQMPAEAGVLGGVMAAALRSLSIYNAPGDMAPNVNRIIASIQSGLGFTWTCVPE